MSDLERDEARTEAEYSEVADTNTATIDCFPPDPKQFKTSALRPKSPARILSAHIGTLVGMKDEGRTPLVVFRGQPGSAAIAARSTLDLHGIHVGRSVVLMFEDGDPLRPIILGCLAQEEATGLSEFPGQVEVDADGERLIVSAKRQLVLRCGKSSVTLTKAGKVLIKGEYVETCSTGTNRIKGGSVQIN
jgi:hypothetical protein